MFIKLIINSLTVWVKEKRRGNGEGLTLSVASPSVHQKKTSKIREIRWFPEDSIGNGKELLRSIV